MDDLLEGRTGDPDNRARLLMLADLGSPHTQRWAVALAQGGMDVMVVGLNPVDQIGQLSSAGIKCEHLGIPRSRTTRGEGSTTKAFFYALSVPHVKRLISAFQPHVLHAHFATSYGFLGAMTGHHPLVISVWGSDIFHFPRQSFVHRWVLKRILGAADVVASTSYAMAKETSRYTGKHICVTPFGVDTSAFLPMRNNRSSSSLPLTIGTARSLQPKYGIDVLVRALGLIVHKYPWVNLLVVGGGHQKGELEHLAKELGLAGRVRFAGAVSHERVATCMQEMDVFVVPSLAESFGVAALEASACGLPVVASNIGGLPEVVIDGKTGILVPPGDPDALADALSVLIDSPELRTQMGLKGRSFVEERYSWKDSVAIMQQIYEPFCRPKATASARST